MSESKSADEVRLWKENEELRKQNKQYVKIFNRILNSDGKSFDLLCDECLEIVKEALKEVEDVK